MLLARIRPDQLKNEPDQVCATLNKIIDWINLQQKK